MSRRSFLVPVQGSLADAAALIGAFEREMVRVTMEEFASQVALETAIRVDMHRCGFEIRPADGCPLVEATDFVRQSFLNDRRVRCLVSFGGSGMTFMFAAIHEAGERALRSAVPNLVEDVDEGQEIPLLYQFPRGRLAAPKWVSVRKRIPTLDERIAQIERRVGKRSEGRYELAIPHVIDREEMRVYGAPMKGSALSIPRLAERSSNAPTFVDHADFVRTFDNKLFVAIMDAGISPKDRVILHLSDREISFLQGGRTFGTVIDIPSRVNDLLKSRKTVNVVEMRRGAGRNEVKARHVAMIRDVSSNEGAGSILSAWKAKAIPGSRAGESVW
jgi:hypothetical protein